MMERTLGRIAGLFSCRSLYRGRATRALCISGRCFSHTDSLWVMFAMLYRNDPASFPCLSLLSHVRVLICPYVFSCEVHRDEAEYQGVQMHADHLNHEWTKGSSCSSHNLLGLENRKAWNKEQWHMLGLVIGQLVEPYEKTTGSLQEFPTTTQLHKRSNWCKFILLEGRVVNIWVHDSRFVEVSTFLFVSLFLCSIKNTLTS